VNGELYVTNLGAGFGTRDALFVLMLLELVQRFGLPDVDFVLYTEVRSSAYAPLLPPPKKTRDFFLAALNKCILSLTLVYCSLLPRCYYKLFIK